MGQISDLFIGEGGNIGVYKERSQGFAYPFIFQRRLLLARQAEVDYLIDARFVEHV